jgi:hypothetical protein
MQTRTFSGKEFEDSLDNTIWVRKEMKPKLVWDVDGNNVIDKIKNTNFDVTKFNLSPQSSIKKSDFVYKDNPNLTFEVKKYKTNQFNSWTLYSEPFFKVANKSQLSQISQDEYNKFVDDFYEHRKDIITQVLDGIVKSNIGIRCVDGFIPQDKLEFKVEVVNNAWAGYKRITVLCRLKKG